MRDDLEQAAKAYHRAQKLADQRREALFEEIRKAVADPDIKQVEIVDITGYTREHIRRIAKSQ